MLSNEKQKSILELFARIRQGEIETYRWNDKGWRFYEPGDGELITVFAAGESEEGHEGVLHGGITAMVLDETMGRAVNNLIRKKDGLFAPKCVTAEMTTKYKKPILTGMEVVAYSKVEREEGKCLFAQAVIMDAEGQLMATASGRFVKVNNFGKTA